MTQARWPNRLSEIIDGVEFRDGLPHFQGAARSGVTNFLPYFPAEAEATLRQLTDQMSRLLVTAPVKGVIKQLAIHGAGTVIAPGSVVAEIVPSDRTMFAQVEVLPAEIGRVHVGGEALVKVSTFDPVRFGGVAGVVSPAAFRRPDGTTVFKVRVRLLAQSVGSEAMDMRLTPGMTVTADIVGGEKTALQYLLKPVRAAFERAMREY